MRIKINTRRILFALLLFPVLCNAAWAEKKAVISGHLPLIAGYQSFIVKAYPYGMNELLEEYTVTLTNGHFTLTLDLARGPMYIECQFPHEYAYYSNIYLVEPGDSIVVSDHNKKIVFSGPGSAKFICSDSLLRIYHTAHLKKWGSGIDVYNKPSTAVWKYMDSIGLMQLRYLEQCKKGLSTFAYKLYRIDMMAEMVSRKDRGLLASDLRQDSIRTLALKDSVNTWRNELWKKLLTMVQADPGIAGYSKGFYESVFARYRFDYLLLPGRRLNLSQYTDYVVRDYTGLLREKLITQAIFATKKTAPDLGEVIAKTDPYITTKSFVLLVDKIGTNLIPGAKAYNFSLMDVHGALRSLSDYRNKVVILDFWFTGCGPCVGMNRALKEVESVFAGDSNVVFVSVSKDEDKDKWLKSVQSGLYTTESRVNVYTNGQGEDYPMIDHYAISGYPTLIIIDKNGRLGEKFQDPRMDKGVSLIACIRKQL